MLEEVFAQKNATMIIFLSIFKIGGKVKQMTGKIGEAIMEATKAENAEMLIVGTRGMGQLRRTFLGSVSDYCLHHSPVPVLICRNKPAHAHEDSKTKTSK